MGRLGSKCTICTTQCQESSEENLSRFANKRLVRIFCEYFNLSSSQYESMEGFYFCTNCRAQVHRLCFLNKRLQETQSEITKIVAKFTLTIIETESSQENNFKCTKQTTNKSLIKIEDTSRYGELEDEHVVEFSQEIQDARSFIYKSYQPQVVLTQCEDIPNVSRRKRKCVKPISLHSVLSDNEWDPIDDDNFWDASPNSSVHFKDEFINITSTSLGQEVIEKDPNDSVLSTPKSNTVKKIRKRRCEDNQVDKKIIPRKKKKLPSSPSIFNRKRVRNRNRVSTATQKVKIRVQKWIRQSEYLFQYGSWSLEQDPVTKYFKCLTCGKSRKTRRDIIRHVNCKHNSERPSCQVCGKSWENPKRLDDHKCIPKSADKRRSCKKLPQGQFIYMEKWSFEKVNKDDENDAQYKCHTCDVVKYSLARMYVHLSHCHANPNKYICELCGKHYAIRAKFEAHQTIHKEARDIICEICGKNFRTKGVLNVHMQGHQDRRWTCEICGRSFKYSKGLGKHRRDVKHFKGSQPPLQPPAMTQEQSPRDFVEKRPETTSSTELASTVLPTDYSLSHLIFQERLQAEYSQSLRNLPF